MKLRRSKWAERAEFLGTLRSAAILVVVTPPVLSILKFGARSRLFLLFPFIDRPEHPPSRLRTTPTWPATRQAHPLFIAPQSLRQGDALWDIRRPTRVVIATFAAFLPALRLAFANEMPELAEGLGLNMGRFVRGADTIPTSPRSLSRTPFVIGHGGGADQVAIDRGSVSALSC